jgi:imidazolonepropionase-like amidohydrolase
LLAKNNTWQVPTLVWTRTQADPEAAPTEFLKYVPASIREQWKAQSNSAEQLAEYKRDAAQGPVTVRQMREGGVRFLAGSDGPDPMLVPGFSLHREMELLVECGFTPLEALQTATLNPSQFLGMGEKYGTVEKGRVADLVLLDANPLLDIRNTAKIAGVMVEGEYHSREELDRVLAGLEAEARKQ